MTYIARDEFEGRMRTVEVSLREIQDANTAGWKTVEQLVTSANANTQMKHDALNTVMEEYKQTAKDTAEKLAALMDLTNQTKKELDKLEVEVEKKGGEKEDKGGRLNDLKSLQLSTGKFGGNVDPKSPGFPAWREDVEVMANKAYKGIDKILKSIRFEKMTVSKAMYETKVREKKLEETMKKHDFEEMRQELYLMLRRFTQGEPKSMVETSNSCGFEAYRLLNRNCDDHASGKLSQLREDCTRLGHNRCKDNKELQKQYQKLLTNIAAYRKAAGEELGDETKCDILMKMVPTNVRSHLVLNQAQGDYDKVKDLVEHVLSEESPQTSGRPILNLGEWQGSSGGGGDSPEEGKEEEETLNQLMGKGGRGSETRKCFKCDQTGHIAAHCKSGGGKAKGKGGPKGGCYLCGGPHRAAECQGQAGKGGGKADGGGKNWLGWYQKGGPRWNQFQTTWNTQMKQNQKGQPAWGKGFYGKAGKSTGKGGVYNLEEQGGYEESPWETQAQEPQEWAEPAQEGGIFAGGTFSLFREMTRGENKFQALSPEENGTEEEDEERPLGWTPSSARGPGRGGAYRLTMGAFPKPQEAISPSGSGASLAEGKGNQITTGLVPHGVKLLPVCGTKVVRVDEEGKAERVTLEKTKFEEIPVKRKVSQSAKKRRQKLCSFIERPTEEGGVLMQFTPPQGAGWKKITATVDSGSTETVTNEEDCSNVETMPSQKSQAGVIYECADKSIVENKGEKICEVGAQGFMSSKKMTLQVANVHKTLISVHRLEEAGNSVMISRKWGAYIENDITGERTHMKRRGGLYEIDLWVRPFARRG